MNECISGIIGGILVGIFFNLIPISILLLYISERRKDPKGFKKVEDDFIKYLKGEI